MGLCILCIQPHNLKSIANRCDKWQKTQLIRPTNWAIWNTISELVWIKNARITITRTTVLLTRMQYYLTAVQTNIGCSYYFIQLPNGSAFSREIACYFKSIVQLHIPHMSDSASNTIWPNKRHLGSNTTNNTNTLIHGRIWKTN